MGYKMGHVIPISHPNCICQEINTVNSVKVPVDAVSGNFCEIFLAEATLAFISQVMDVKRNKI